MNSNPNCSSKTTNLVNSTRHEIVSDFSIARSLYSETYFRRVPSHCHVGLWYRLNHATASKHRPLKNDKTRHFWNFSQVSYEQRQRLVNGVRSILSSDYNCLAC